VGLHSLVAYMKEGIQSELFAVLPSAYCRSLFFFRALAPAHADVGGKPFDVGPKSQHWVVEHLCQCKYRCCCAPWHLQIRSSRTNTMTGQYARSNRGVWSATFDYKVETPNIEANPGVRPALLQAVRFGMQADPPCFFCFFYAGWTQQPPNPSTSAGRY
jgi:hypothetical protein